ncbi:MAG: HAMP domain-containing histidine kinase [Thermoplasmata archaeon]|nr:HAMP domain-containing histidine kinase [Thermoplasmata archaeon]
MTIWHDEPEKHRIRAVLTLNRLILALCLSVAIIALTALLGWIMGWDVLTGAVRDYQPISPSSALIALALSCLVYVYAVHRKARWADRLLKVGIGIILVALMWTVIHGVTKIGPCIETILGPEDVSGLPFEVSHMSPLATWSYMGLGFSMFALQVFPEELKRLRSLLAIIPLAVFCVGFIATLGYIYGSPLLYGGSVRPIAWPAAVSVLVLGIALLASLATEYWPMRLFVGKSIKATMMRWLTSVLVVSIIITDWLHTTMMRSGVDIIVSVAFNALVGLFVGIVVALAISHMLGGRFDRMSDERTRHIADLALANKKLRLLGSMTRHDIKNQLTILKNWMGLARSREIDEIALENLKNALDSAQTIDEQLDFTSVYERLGAHEGEWRTLSKEFASGISGIETPGVSIDSKLNGIEVFADPMLSMVFKNLMVNTLMHGGKVSKVRVYVDRDDHGIRVVFEDDGVGIPLEDKGRVFERGFGKHTGYGMFLAREILELTGMRISETGISGKGARFEIAVPEGRYRR